jgi:SAM-dependent methyltransferase
MSKEGTLTALYREERKTWRSYLPFPLELEWCACPICSSSEATTLLRFDQFGFPIGTVECQQCGFVYTNPRPSETYMKAFYETHFWFFFQGRHEINERFLRRQRTREWAALRLARCAPYLSEAKSILDVGCGAGLFLDQVRRRFPNSAQAGIEPDPKMARCCREKLALDVYEGFFQDYPSNRRFDVITLFHVIEHLFDFTSLFKFIREHLTPGGVVIAEAPNVDGEWKTIYMIQLSHLHIFSPRTISELFLRNGFEVVQTSCLQNELDESNLSIVARMKEGQEGTIPPRDPNESMRIRAKFQQLRANRILRVLRAWVRLAYFAVRR